jgi:hypothetical protein
MPEIVVYAALNFAYQVNETARTISLGTLLYDEGSPGKVFKLTESALCGAIEMVARNYEGLGLDDAAGKLQMRFEREPIAFAEEILNHYYTAR